MWLRFVWGCVLSLGATAHANMAPSTRSPAALSLDPREASTPVEVLSEHLLFDCVPVSRGEPCAFEATYDLRNPTAERLELDPLFLGLRTSEVQVQLDAHAPVALAATPTKDGEGRELAAQLDEDPYALDRFPFHLALEAGQRRTVVIRGRMAPGRRFLPEGYVFPALQARHALLGPERIRDDTFDIDYLLGPIRSWSGDPSIEVTVRVPKDWRVGTSPERRAWSMPEASGWTQAREAAVERATRSFRASSAPAVLNVTVTRPKTLVNPGGVQLGLGSSLGPEARFRARLGYQFGTGPWLLHSLSLETDFRDQLVVTPLVQAAAPQLLLIPSAGLGLGVPLRVAPTFRPGARVLVDLHFFLLGLVFTWDYFPAYGGAQALSQLTLMGQVAL